MTCRRRRSVCRPGLPAVVVCLLVAAVARAADAPGADDTYDRLSALLEVAGDGRQVGLPGNAAVDDWAAQQFARLAEARNDTTQARRAETLLGAVLEANGELAAAQAERERLTQDDALIDSFWLIRFTLERPWPSVLVLLLVTVLFFSGWQVRRRRAHLAVAIGALILALIMPVLAWLIRTPAERTLAGTDGDAATVSGPKSTAQLDRRVLDAARAALEADRAAADALEALWQHGRIHFPSAAYLPGNAVLSSGDRSVELFQMAPNLVEPSNLPPEGCTGPMVYAGRALPDDVEGIDFAGSVAIVEFDSANRWLDCVALGAEVVLVLEPPATDARGATFAEATQKRADTPLSVPRFYARRDAFTAAFGDPAAEGTGAATVHVQQTKRGRWERQVLAIDWLFIPGTVARQADATFEEDTGRQLVHIQAYKDSRSIVPDLAPGANSAANLVLLVQLAEHFARHPPRRPVLLSAVNDHTNALNGEQHYAFTAFADPADVLAEITHVEQQLAREQFVHEIYRQKPSTDVIERMRVESTFAGGQVLKLRDAAQKRLTYLRNILRDRRHGIEFELTHGDGVSEARRTELEAELERANAKAEELVLLMGLFNRFGRRTQFDALNAAQRQRLQALFEDVADTARIKAATSGRDHRELVANMALRRRLRFLAVDDDTEPAGYADVFARRHPPLPAIVTLCLDLSFGTDRLGLFQMGVMYGGPDQPSLDRVSRLAGYTVKLAAEHAEDAGGAGGRNPFVDTLRNVGGVAWEAHLGGRLAMGSRPVHDYRVAGVTLAGVRDLRVRAYTPHDTLDRIDRDHFDGLMRFARGFVPRLVNAPELGLTRQVRGQLRPATVRLDVRVLDKYSAGVSETRLPDAVTAAYKEPPKPTEITMTGQVRRWAVLVADPSGGVLLRGSGKRGASMLAYGFDEKTGRINAALDVVMGEKQFPSTLDVSEKVFFAPRSIMTFRACKVDLIGITEPLTLGPVATIDVIDAAQESEPRHYLLNGVLSATKEKTTPAARDGTACLFLEPWARFKLRTGEGLVINADANAPEGLGYGADVGRLTGLASSSARDMLYLTDQRLNLLNGKGVVNDTATAFNRRAGDWAERSRAAAEEHANARAESFAGRAQGEGYRGYVRALGTINDLIKAIILFLMLVIPFCYFLMKLVTPFTSMNQQLGMFALIFILTALLLQGVHPAFAVAQTPTMVLLAFAILGLAGFVALILVGQFNESMTHAVEEVQMSESTDAPQSRLAGVAFVVGVNNMKRRRIRTTLTCVTIVLVTFTMLSVISVGQDVEPVRLRLSRGTPYDGWLYSRPSLAAISPLQLRRLRAQYAGRATAVARAWVQRKGVYGEYLTFEVQPARRLPGAMEATLQAKVVLGMEVAEDGLVDRMPMLPGGRWFSANDAREIVLSAKSAAFLGLTAENFHGTTLSIGGLDLQLVGLLDDKRFEALHDQGDVPLVPLLTQAKVDTVKETEQLAAETKGEASLQAGGDLLADPGVEPAEAKDLAIVPLEVAGLIGEAEFRTLSFKYERGEGDEVAPAQRVWDDANQFIDFQHARISVGLTEPVDLEAQGRTVEAGTYALAASSSTEIGGVLKVAIPVVLAATIILNTMLGAVMERKREVGIYNAIGLNPGHVMMFFLAESIVFGLVGSVAGYLIGQLLSLVLKHFLELNLNYSSMSVMVVILLAIATVLLSTVYPAMMAARAAVPSGQRRWSLPQPEGDEIRVDFPFSYDRTRVLGVCAYLHEYMLENSEASTGRFLARTGPIGLVPADGADDADDERAFAMVYDIAPAPFDLGVNQKMEVYACYNRRVRAHMLSVHLTRVSGQTHNWVHVNQPFLESLRKRLLGWRSQRPEHQQSYYQRGDELFRDAVDLPLAETEAVV